MADYTSVLPPILTPGYQAPGTVTAKGKIVGSTYDASGNATPIYDTSQTDKSVAATQSTAPTADMVQKVRAMVDSGQVKGGTETLDVVDFRGQGPAASDGGSSSGGGSGGGSGSGTGGSDSGSGTGSGSGDSGVINSLMGLVAAQYAGAGVSGGSGDVGQSAIAASPTSAPSGSLNTAIFLGLAIIAIVGWLIWKNRKKHSS